MSSEISVKRAIANAERILPGVPAVEGKRDRRWQAIICVGQFIQTHPEEVWTFTRKWAKHPQWDLRAAIACCLLEHLIEEHFDLLFPKVEAECRTSPRFASTYRICCAYVRRSLPQHEARLLRLDRAIVQKRIGSSKKRNRRKYAR